MREGDPAGYAAATKHVYMLSLAWDPLQVEGLYRFCHRFAERHLVRDPAVAGVLDRIQAAIDAIEEDPAYEPPGLTEHYALLRALPRHLETLRARERTTYERAFGAGLGVSSVRSSTGRTPDRVRLRLGAPGGAV